MKGEVSLNVTNTEKEPLLTGPTPFKEPSYAIWPVVCAICGSFLFGYEVSIFAGAKVLIQDDPDFPHLSTVQNGIVTSAWVFGCLLGAALCGNLLDRFGRRGCLVVASCTYLLGVDVSFLCKVYVELVFGRMITGMATGVAASVVPLYIAELSPARIRGGLVSINQLIVCVGVLGGFVSADVWNCANQKSANDNHYHINVDRYCVHWGTSAWRWMLVTAVPIASLLLIAFLFFAPSSPRWLMSKNRRHEAEASLRSVCPQATEQQVQFMLRQIEGTLEAQTSNWAALLQPNVFYCVKIGGILSAIQQFTGVNAVNFYCQSVLTSAGFSKDQAFFFSIFIGVSKVVFVSAAVLFIDRAGRRVLLMIGTTGMAISTLVLASVFQYKLEHHGEMSTGLGYLALVCLIAFMAFFEIGLGPAVWLLLSEIFPLQVRSKAMAVSAGLNFLFTLIVSLLFPIIVAAWNPAGIFFLFGGACVISVIWIALALPETKGKSLEELESFFRAKTRS
eukprot:m.48477 g.48477  ORF g.48477 m.48477 type:complete len:505 (-) comp17796_c0_seq1:132-1646(-)